MMDSTDQTGLMHALVVGAPHVRGRRSWPEVADYNFRGGRHALRLFVAHPTPREVEAVRTRPVEFGLLVDQPLLVQVVRFLGRSGQVVMSFDCSYSWHRVPAAERVLPPAVEETSPELRALLTIVLVEATTGLVAVVRYVTFSPEFTRGLHRAIADQAALPYDQAEHDRAVEAMRRFTTDQLWAQCKLRCGGGD
jgi:hypothetical protein